MAGPTRRKLDPDYSVALKRYAVLVDTAEATVSRAGHSDPTITQQIYRRRAEVATVMDTSHLASVNAAFSGFVQVSLDTFFGLQIGPFASNSGGPIL
jgi:hypothetical protein